MDLPLKFIYAVIGVAASDDGDNFKCSDRLRVVGGDVGFKFANRHFAYALRSLEKKMDEW